MILKMVMQGIFDGVGIAVRACSAVIAGALIVRAVFSKSPRLTNSSGFSSAVNASSSSHLLPVNNNPDQMNLMSTISTVRGPPLEGICTSSPTSLRMSARANGDLTEINPFSTSASHSPTIL